MANPEIPLCDLASLNWVPRSPASLNEIVQLTIPCVRRVGTHGAKLVVAMMSTCKSDEVCPSKYANARLTSGIFPALPRGYQSGFAKPNMYTRDWHHPGLFWLFLLATWQKFLRQNMETRDFRPGLLPPRPAAIRRSLPVETWTWSLRIKT